MEGVKPDDYIRVVAGGFLVMTRPDPRGDHVAGPLITSLEVAEKNAEVAKRVLKRHRCPHLRRVTKPGDDRFEDREGCLDCDTWLEPVRLRGESA